MHLFFETTTFETKQNRKKNTIKNYISGPQNGKNI